MIHTKICAKCEALLDDAIVALRQHRMQMSTGISLNVHGYLTEELRKELAPILVGSFILAQAAWDDYCGHLIQHGLLTPARKAVQSAVSVTHMPEAPGGPKHTGGVPVKSANMQKSQRKAKRSI